jgi:2-aminoadipate transaminase
VTIHYATRMSGVRPSAIREALRLGADPEIVSFGGGYPDPALFPTAELGEIFHKLLTGAGALQYTESRGLPELREHIARRLTRDGITCGADDVLLPRAKVAYVPGTTFFRSARNPTTHA